MIEPLYTMLQSFSDFSIHSTGCSWRLTLHFVCKAIVTKVLHTRTTSIPYEDLSQVACKLPFYEFFCICQLEVHVCIYRDKVACTEVSVMTLKFISHAKSRMCVAVYIPLYSMPHFNFTTTTLPVNSFKKGLGFTGTVCNSSEWSRTRTCGQAGQRSHDLQQPCPGSFVSTHSLCKSLSDFNKVLRFAEKRSHKHTFNWRNSRNGTWIMLQGLRLEVPVGLR